MSTGSFTKCLPVPGGVEQNKQQTDVLVHFSQAECPQGYLICRPPELSLKQKNKENCCSRLHLIIMNIFNYKIVFTR